MTHELQASLASIPHLDYGEKPKSGTSYWGERERGEIPGREYDLGLRDTLIADEFVEWKSGDNRYSPVDTDEILENMESKFLDELYGTDRDPTTDGAVAIGKDTTAWGLDLRRVTPKETWDVRSDEYYEHLTKGEVNWAHYQQDQRYQSAFKALGYDLKSLGTDTVASVQQIRHANQALDKEFLKAGNVSWKRHWEGKYDEDHIVRDGKDLYVDGVRQKTLSEIYSGGGGRLDISDSDVKNTLGQGFSAFEQKTSSYTQVKKPDSLKIKNIPKVEAKRPANIPASWGPIK